MVNRHREAPTLDRRISLMLPVSRTTTTPAQTFRFTLAPGLSLGVGQYSSNRFQVELFTPDADGLALPDPLKTSRPATS